MNTQRLALISRMLLAEINGSKLVGTINQLVQKTQEAINSPNETTQRAVVTALEQLTQSLSTAESNAFSPGMRTQLEELKINGSTPVSSLIGRGVADQLQDIYSTGYTSVKTLDALRQLEKNLQSLATALDQINKGFTAVSIVDETLIPGQSVVGFSIPRTEIEDGLREFQKQLRFFGRFIEQLTEVVDGAYEPKRIYSIHASDFGIDLFTSLDVASRFSTILIGIFSVLEKIRGLRKVKDDAEHLGMEKEVLDKFTESGNKAMESKLEEINIEIYEHKKLNDEGRATELKSRIRLELNGIANRCDRGFTFEVRTSLPETAADDVKEQATKVNEFTNISFKPLEGERILQLPEPPEDEEKGQAEEEKIGPPPKPKGRPRGKKQTT